jgi:localization factor PodJL
VSFDIERVRAKAEAGSKVSQVILGIALLHGYGCSPDYAGALRWLSPAVERGVPRARVNLGVMYESGLGVPVDIKRARELYEAGARSGEFFGCIYLARLLASGRCGRTAKRAAVRWYREALSFGGGIESCPELDEAVTYLSKHQAKSE